eukprot:gene17026-biopygen18846
MLTAWSQPCEHGHSIVTAVRAYSQPCEHAHSMATAVSWSQHGHSHHGHSRVSMVTAWSQPCEHGHNMGHSIVSMLTAVRVSMFATVARRSRDGR